MDINLSLFCRSSYRAQVGAGVEDREFFSFDVGFQIPAQGGGLLQDINRPFVSGHVNSFFSADESFDQEL